MREPVRGAGRRGAGDAVVRSAESEGPQLSQDGAGPAAQQGRRRNRVSGARQIRLGVGDPQFATAGGARLADDDVDVAAQRRQQPHRALQRILPEVPPEQP